MTLEPSDTLLGVVVIVLAVASVGVWFALFDRLQRGPILAYEPRRPVPWHGAWILLPIALVVLTVGSAIVNQGSRDDVQQASPGELVERIAVGSALQTSLVVAFLALVIFSSHATRADVGLPRDAAELLRDVRIGVIAWLAALVPVYGTQVALLSMFGPSEGHPLLKMVERESNPALYVLAFLAAVVAAPLGEEMTFRLVLQGWLEKWDSRRLAARCSSPELDDAVSPIETMDDSIDVSNLAEAAAANEATSPQINSQRYSWTPIVISSLLFALAHFGYGPDPIPLFLLALVLGYVYQRTHRIVPSIVAHALFNGISLFALWRVMSSGGP